MDDNKNEFEILSVMDGKDIPDKIQKSFPMPADYGLICKINKNVNWQEFNFTFCRGKVIKYKDMWCSIMGVDTKTHELSEYPVGQVFTIYVHYLSAITSMLKNFHSLLQRYIEKKIKKESELSAGPKVEALEEMSEVIDNLFERGYID